MTIASVAAMLNLFNGLWLGELYNFHRWFDMIYTLFMHLRGASFILWLKSRVLLRSEVGMIMVSIWHCPENARQLAYFTLVRSTLEYSCTVWDPHYGKDTDRLEMVNRRAARIVKGRSLRDGEVSVTALLDDLKWKTLEERRKDLRLILMYKIVNGLVAVPTTPLKPALGRTRANHQFKYQTIRTNCDTVKYSYFPRTIPEWNNLKSDIVNSPSVDAFKARLSKP